MFSSVAHWCNLTGRPESGGVDLADAILEAKAWFESRYDSLPPYYEGERWFFPTTEEMFHNVMSNWRTPDSYPIDARGTVYTLAFFSAKHLGQSQYYLLNGRDKNGKPLEGNTAYRLRVPANAPVTQYWSMTVYDRDTHAFIRRAKWAGRASQTPGLQKNQDGSTDIFFGPKPPAGGPNASVGMLPPVGKRRVER